MEIQTFTIGDGLLLGLMIGLTLTVLLLLYLNWKLDHLGKEQDLLLKGYEDLVRKQRNG